jgi:threonyl-tRNA synthetase
MDLFSFHEEGPGFLLSASEGDGGCGTSSSGFWRQVHQKYGYVEIKTPIILNESPVAIGAGTGTTIKRICIFTTVDEVHLQRSSR